MLTAIARLPSVHPPSPCVNTPAALHAGYILCQARPVSHQASKWSCRECGLVACRKKTEGVVLHVGISGR